MTRYTLLAVGLCCLGCATAQRSKPGRITPSELGYRAGLLRGASLEGETSDSPTRMGNRPQEPAGEAVKVRGQSPEPRSSLDGAWDGNAPMRASQPIEPRVAQARDLWNQGGTAPGYGAAPGYTSANPYPTTAAPALPGPPGYTPYTPPTTQPRSSGVPGSGPGPGNVPASSSGWNSPTPYPNAPSGPPLGAPLPPPGEGPWSQFGSSPFDPGTIPANIEVDVEETTTGRFMVGAGVNSDAGVTGQIVIDEQNFDWRRFPSSFDQVLDGTAFRGGGQRFRIEAMPGTQVQRYMVNFVEPYLWDTRISLSLSAFLFDRNYFDWDERRWGGRMGLGYRLTPDWSLNVSGRGENVNIRNPRIRGVQQLEDVLGSNELFSGKVTLAHDTRDVPFFPTKGHLLEFSYEQVFGQFDYPHASVDFRKYFLLMERPDQSGRHVLANSFRYSMSGSDTPLFENFFAGGHTTMRGFSFRGASPQEGGVTVGGQLSLLGSTEYIFPITADDMLRGVFFCDYGTIEEEQTIHWEDFRVAVGFGLRITVPAMGPAPISLDLAVPLAREGTDDIQNFSFYMGVGR